MSTLDPSTPGLPARTPDVGALVGTLRRAVSGAAFWASIPLPLVIVAVLLSGTATATPMVFVGLVVLNACCAAIGHTYTPAR
ncbi:hypothetical protein [Haloarcula salinisoli]|uniref:Uncharacterized protein n=1 Tax=Haloarcula salinisoli TaxID=2487746 RepID=A0A8J7YMA7_9EURY|nr:hypothetical protein [Halomicroarcula salinisoli]MBX0288427.1 hypothetical protein [Halomicroarcula salinisoli]MBX0305911.1 hypothetical protein [Halomicroarcula salinisoli]